MRSNRTQLEHVKYSFNKRNSLLLFNDDSVLLYHYGSNARWLILLIRPDIVFRRMDNYVSLLKIIDLFIKNNTIVTKINSVSITLV